MVKLKHVDRRKLSEKNAAGMLFAQKRDPMVVSQSMFGWINEVPTLSFEQLPWKSSRLSKS